MTRKERWREGAECSKNEIMFHVKQRMIIKSVACGGFVYGKSVARGAFPPFFDLMAPNIRYQLKLFVPTIIDLAKPLSAYSKIKNVNITV